MVLCKDCKKSFHADDFAEHIVKCPVTGHLRHEEMERACDNFDPRGEHK